METRCLGGKKSPGCALFTWDFGCVDRVLVALRPLSSGWLPKS
jgi:hypothetical protein